MGYDHVGWQPLMKLLTLLVKKYSGVIYDKELHTKWDIGQAICRGTYGKGWNTNPQKLKDDDAEVAPEAAIRTARDWLENGLPKWAEVR